MGTTAHLARWWHSQEDGIICCNLCPRHCRIANNHFGYCQVRFAKDGKLFTLAYGQSSGFAVDPIEKKPLFHFLPGTNTFSFGTQSCNLECVFCQNWRITQRNWDENLTTEASPEAIATAAKENLCPSVSFTYNEPLISLEHVVDTAKYCHQLGIRTIAVTNGFISKEARENFFSAIDAANVDLKGFQEKFYQNYCKASLKPVLDTLEYIVNKTQTWLEVTTLLIPGANDSTTEINDMTKWINNHLGPHVPLHFSAFHPSNKLTNVATTPAATLWRARDIAKANGLHHVYTGNIADATSQTTHCAECSHILIEREGFHTTKNHLNDGKCPRCEVPLAGIFIRQNSLS
jgi:pyruvate formate lyase activating enzyme